jgi:uncharacterized protein (DUF1684 family)
MIMIRKSMGLHVIFTLLMAMPSLAFPPADQPKPAPDAAYQKSFDQWEKDLVQDRKENWLTLAGLFWLKPGDNTFGSDAANAVVFPKGPAHAGVLTLQGQQVTVNFSADANATIAGKPVQAAKLEPDTADNTTVVEMGDLRWHIIIRGQRVGVRLKDLNSEAARKYKGPEFFPVDLSYRVTATWIPSDGKKTVDVPDVLGDINPTPIAGTAVFKLNGVEYRLTDLGGSAANGLFFVFSDPTGKTDTYPGGRFLTTDPVANGTVVLDFNRAHNPPCSVTPYATCPLAPKENRLAVAIPAGEKYDRTHGHH